MKTRLFLSLLLLFATGCSAAAPEPAPEVEIEAPVIDPTATLEPTETALPAPTETTVPDDAAVPTYTPPPLVRPEGDQISGTYRVGDPDSGDYCTLSVILIPVDGKDQLGFDLFCNSGEPSFNMGLAFGRVPLEEDYAVYIPEISYTDEDCVLEFAFSQDQIEVLQTGSDAACGFGAGVYADGIYDLIDDTPPEIGCFFSDLCSGDGGE